MASNKIKCIWISVDCTPNEPDAVFSGEPTYLGYDFCVMAHNKESYKEFILNQLAEYEIPLIAISYGVEELKYEEDVDTEEIIEDAIMSSADAIKRQARRNYRRAFSI